MKLDDIRLMNDSMIKYLESMGKSTERNEIVKHILEDDECLQKLSKEDMYIVLKDVGVSEDKIEAVYSNLVSINN